MRIKEIQTRFSDNNRSRGKTHTTIEICTRIPPLIQIIYINNKTKKIDCQEGGEHLVQSPTWRSVGLQGHELLGCVVFFLRIKYHDKFLTNKAPFKGYSYMIGTSSRHLKQANPRLLAGRSFLLHELFEARLSSVVFRQMTRGQIFVEKMQGEV